MFHAHTAYSDTLTMLVQLHDIRQSGHQSKRNYQTKMALPNKEKVNFPKYVTIPNVHQAHIKRASKYIKQQSNIKTKSTELKGKL